MARLYHLRGLKNIIYLMHQAICSSGRAQDKQHNRAHGLNGGSSHPKHINLHLNHLKPSKSHTNWQRFDCKPCEYELLTTARNQRFTVSQNRLLTECNQTLDISRAQYEACKSPSGFEKYCVLIALGFLNLIHLGLNLSASKRIGIYTRGHATLDFIQWYHNKLVALKVEVQDLYRL